MFSFLLLPVMALGQVQLCGKCALTITEDVKTRDCCEQCLQDYYISLLKDGKTVHGNLSRYTDSWSTYLPFPDTLTSRFEVVKVEQAPGFCLKSSELQEYTYYLFHLQCEDSTAVPPGTQILLVVNDGTIFKVGEYYDLSIVPYFKRNQSFSIVDGKLLPVVGCRTVFDLVYKDWLIAFLDVSRNYFFLSREISGR